MNKRLDEWTCVYEVSKKSGSKLNITGSVFRGMNDLKKAQDYARLVEVFFKSNGIDKRAYVIKGPTSTTNCKYEVVTAICGYPLVCQ